MFSRQFCNAIGQDNKKTIVSQKLANYIYASAVPRELCDKIRHMPVTKCGVMVLYSPTKLFRIFYLEKYFFSALS